MRGYDRNCVQGACRVENIGLVRGDNPLVIWNQDDS